MNGPEHKSIYQPVTFGAEGLHLRQGTVSPQTIR